MCSTPAAMISVALDVDAIQARLQMHVQHLAGTIGERNVFHPAALEDAAAYITQIWESQGYTVMRQPYTVQGVESANLEVTRIGYDAPKVLLLIGAHYDSVFGSPGGNDNGSGVAALLELSRLFAVREPGHSIRFVAFTNEEPPFFATRRQGSMVYARQARQRGDNIPLMVALETIGCYRDAPRSQAYPPFFRFFFPDRANFVAFVSNFHSRRFMRRLARLFRAGSDFPLEHAAAPAIIPGVAWSDHRSFWRHGYRALMVTDTAFYRYPEYHTAQDTADRLDYVQFARMTGGLFSALVRMDAEGFGNVFPRR